MIPHRKRAQMLLTRRGRETHGQILVEGVRLVEEALAAGLDIPYIYHVTPQSGTRASRALVDAAARGIKLVEMAPDELADLTDTETPQGIVALATVPRWAEDDLWARPGDLVVLDNVRDPGNAGTLLRAAEAAGARGIVAMQGTVELANPKVVRASMGSFFRLPAVISTDPDAIAARCRAAGIPVVTTALEAAESAAVLATMPAAAIVLGGEAEGADPAWARLADRVVRIPMQGPVESLNVAVAGAILLFRRIWSA